MSTFDLTFALRTDSGDALRTTDDEILAQEWGNNGHQVTVEPEA